MEPDPDPLVRDTDPNIRIQTVSAELAKWRDCKNNIGTAKVWNDLNT